MSRRSGPPSNSSSPLSRSVAVTVSGIFRYSKCVLGTRRAMARRSAAAGKRLRANRPMTSTSGSNGATSLRLIPMARRRIWSNGIPAARAAPTTAPIDVATIWLGTRLACSRARKAPACASAFAPPPDNTKTTLLTPALIVAAFHHPLGAPLRGPVVAPLLVRSLGHDRRNFGGTAVLVERDVRDVTGVGVAAVTRQHVFREHLHADFHRRPAREVHARHRGHQLTDVNRLAKIDLVHRHRDAFAVRVANGGDRGDAIEVSVDVAAEHIAHDVRVMRHHQLGEDGFRFTGMTAGGGALGHQ